MHEIQHKIQRAEGFAKGSNPDYFSTDALKKEAFEQHSREIQRLMDLDPDAARAYRALNQYQARVRGTPEAQTEAAWDHVEKLAEELRKTPIGRQLSDMDWTRQSVQSFPEDHWRSVARQKYGQHAGEVEARLVQERRKLTPEQRRARAPWLEYDVPEEQQIIRH